MDVISIIVIVFAVALVILFAFRSRVMIVIHYALYVLFPVMVIILLSTVLLPGVYYQLADNMLASAGTKQAVTSLDQNITSVSTLPNDVLNGIRNLTGQDTVESSAGASGGIYIAIVNSVGGVIRILALAGSAVLSVILLYLMYVVSAATKVERLAHRVRKIEHQIQQ